MNDLDRYQRGLLWEESKSLRLAELEKYILANLNAPSMLTVAALHTP